MPLVVVVPSAAPLRRPQPFRFLHPRRNLALTTTRCAPSPPAEAQSVKPRRYPKQFPGEAVGVAEEMRFVAMRLRNPKRTTLNDNTGAAGAVEEDDHEVKEEESNSEVEEEEDDHEVKGEEEEEDGVVMEGEWMPSIEGFVRYLVDSKLVFDTVERVVAGSTDVA